jgi:hypothetical protein
MEIEEFCMFPGCCLVEHESCLAKGVANAEVWKVLVPLKMMAGFEGVISSLEVAAWRPEQITDGRTIQNAGPGDGGTWFQFQPP